MKRTKISAFILAGGQSRRIGKDKLFEKVNNTTLLQKTITTCQKVFDSLSIVAKEKEKFQSNSLPVILDSELANGPMSGIISALENSKDEYCFVTAADFYDLDEKVIINLLRSYRNEQYLGLNINTRIQPLCGIYHVSCLTKLKEIAKTGDYRMISALKQLQSKFKETSILKWRNVNLKEDLESIRSENV